MLNDSPGEYVTEKGPSVPIGVVIAKGVFPRYAEMVAVPVPVPVHPPPLLIQSVPFPCKVQALLAEVKVSVIKMSNGAAPGSLVAAIEVRSMLGFVGPELKPNAELIVQSPTVPL